MSRKARRTLSLVSLLMPLAVWIPAPALPDAPPAEEKAPPHYSKRFDFVAGQDIPINQTIGGAHFGVLRIDTEAWKSGGHHIRIRIHVHVPEDTHDQQVTARVELADREGKVVASDEIEQEVEEEQAKVLKLSAHLDDDPAALVATVLLELNSRPD